MLTYPTCQKLKDAGFPYSEQWEIEDDKCGGVCFRQGRYPDLGELIDACGNEFKALVKHDPLDDSMLVFRITHGDFSAEMYDRDRSMFKNTMFGGSSPEEAVAALYLAINNK